MTTPSPIVLDPTAPAPRQGILRKLVRNPLGLTALIALGVVVALSVFAPLLTGLDPTRADLNSVLQPPGDGHLLGADGAGRDVWSRILYGGRISLLAGALAVFVAMFIGVPSGLIGGYRGGRTDALMGWVSDSLMSVPAIVLLFAVIAAVGPSTWTTMVVFGFLLAPTFYRLVRGSVRAVNAELYIDAARVSGLSDARIIRRHVLRVVRAPIIIQGSFVAGVAIVLQAGLEFLGLGEPNSPSWGAMLNDGFTNIYTAPLLMIWPGVMIGVTVGALAIIGTALRDALSGGGPTPARRRKSAMPAGPPDQREPAPAVSGPAAGDDVLMQVTGLTVSYQRPGGSMSTVVDDVSLFVNKGETLGLVGESGSGKTQTAFALLGLLPDEAHSSATSLTFDNKAVTLSGRAALRGQQIGYVPQEPMSNLDPSYRIGPQLTEPMRHHLGLFRKAAKKRALELLDDVGIVDPERVYRAFPHEISGGMAQRVLIAGAICCEPAVLIADEPTTALDVTVQAEVLDLLRSLQTQRDLAVILVTHDFGVVADSCTRVAVMQRGRIVEHADVHQLFARPEHPYTKLLLDSTFEGGSVRTYTPPMSLDGGASV